MEDIGLASSAFILPPSSNNPNFCLIPCGLVEDDSALCSSISQSEHHIPLAITVGSGMVT